MPGLPASEVAAALCDFIAAGYETKTAPFKGEFRLFVEERQECEDFFKGLICISNRRGGGQEKRTSGRICQRNWWVCHEFISDVH